VQPPPRPDNSPPNFDHFNTSPQRAGPPLAATSSLQPSRCGAHPGPSRSDPRLRHSDNARLPTPRPGLGSSRMASAGDPSHSRSRHVAVHGSARPAVTLGFATPTRPGSPRQDPDSDGNHGIRVTQGHVTPVRAGPSTALTRTRTTRPNSNRRHLRTCRFTADAPLWQVRGTSRRCNHVSST
jgi:hypothetical protein